MKTKILYVEDEIHLGRIVKETLESQNYEINWVSDGARVISQLQECKPDIVVLDIMLPNVDGYELCGRIKALFPSLPVIFLTAKVETADLIKGFEAGGTDYIRKPFSIEELIVRIRNQLKLSQGKDPNDLTDKQEIAFGQFKLFPHLYELHGPSGVISLSQRDMQILNMLTSSINRVLDRKQLLLSVWGDDSFFNSRNLDVYIRKIRKYLQEDESIRIQTIKGKGYLFFVERNS